MLVNRSGSVVLFFLSMYLTKELGFSIESAGIMLSLYGGGSLIGALVGGNLTDRFGANRVQFVSLPVEQSVINTSIT